MSAAEELRVLAGMARARNGRLEINWISRYEKPRWKMIKLDGEWYDRERLKKLLDRRPKPEIVPGGSRRKLTAAELSLIRDTTPYSLDPLKLNVS